MKSVRLAWPAFLLVFAWAALLSSCGKKEEPASAVADDPVYNAHISPQFAPPGNSPHPAVREGTLTTLSFAIDLPWTDSETHAKPNAEITGSPTDVPLTVTLACDFCTQHEPFIARTIYRPGKQRSDTVVFNFVPVRDKRANAKHTQGKLILSILNRSTGREYDRLPLPVTILADEGSEASDRKDAIGTSVMPRRQDEQTSKTDVFLHVLNDDAHGLAVAIEPIEPRLVAAVGSMVTDESGGLRVFQTGLSSAEQLQKVTFSAYAKVARLSHQQDSDAVRKRDGIPTIAKDHQVSLALSPEESKGAQKLLTRFGKQLYRRLFLDGRDGKELSAVFAKLEGLDIGRPVRLTIRTDDISLPWQYLYPQQQAEDPWQFWGIKFSLAVRRAEDVLYTGGDATADPSSLGQLVFARYGVKDDTTPYADKQLTKLRELQGMRPLEVVDSKEELKQALTGHRNSISAIFTFLHATSGRMDLDLGNGQAASMTTNSGPLLSFQPQGEDDVTSGELEGLRDDVSRDEFHQRPYLSAAPLVILNACETGPSTISVPYLSLQETMFMLGARGVLVTEVPVWISLGHEVSIRMIEKLSKGETASDAITAVRRELLEKSANPLGLLYSYYGDPDATLRTSVQTAKAGK